MTVYYEDDLVTVHHGDCLHVLAALPDASIDAVVTDPPYGLAEHNITDVARAIAAWVGGDRHLVPDGKGFMGTSWDAFVPPPGVWDEVMRVLKPGGHLLAFAAPRTADLMGISIRLAGFQMRNGITWHYGNGFSKSWNFKTMYTGRWCDCTPAVPDAVCSRCGGLAQVYRGFGTGIKPASEPVVVARKPLAGTVAATVLQYGTGALNIDASRVPASGRPLLESQSGATLSTYGDGLNGSRAVGVTDEGRWPSNVVFSHASTPDGYDACADGCVPGCPVLELDQQSGTTRSADTTRNNTAAGHNSTGSMGKSGGDWATRGHADEGGASRFFPTFRYQAKAPASERGRDDGVMHPTVKPVDLMRWLVRLVTPTGGVVLDPFAGSGATGEAATREGFRSVLIERDAQYLPKIRNRMTRRRDPFRYLGDTGGDLGLFEL